MRRNEINRAYFEWMQDLVRDDRAEENGTYYELFRVLHDIDFTYTIPLDGDRASDGVNLRYRFAHDTDLDRRIAACELDAGPCSVLEMMVALAARCEGGIMDDPELGDRTGHWFWTMIENLGLIDMTDDYFDEPHVRRVIRTFLNREYAPDGTGGLFRVYDSRQDMRTITIWYQMCAYLSSMF